MSEHPARHKQSHKITVEDVVRYLLAVGVPREQLVSRIRSTHGMFGNVSQRRVNEALAEVEEAAR